MAKLKSRQSDLMKQLSDERRLRQSTERNVEFLQEKLDYVNQEKVLLIRDEDYHIGYKGCLGIDSEEGERIE